MDRAPLPNYAGRNWSGEIFRGTSTYDPQGGRMVPQKAGRLRDSVRDKGGGVKKSESFADIIYGWSLGSQHAQPEGQSRAPVN